MIRINFILLIITLSVIGCKEKSDNILFVFDKNSIEQMSLKSETISISQILNPLDVLFSNNFLYISHAPDNKQLSIYDLKNNNILGKFIEKGKGPQELLSVQSISKNEKLRTITLYDFITARYIVCRIPDLERCIFNIIESGEAKLNFNKEQVLFTNDSCITYIGLEERIVSQNNEGFKVNSFGDYKIFDNHEEAMWLPQIYKGQIAYNEKTNHYAIFDRLTDKVEFYMNEALTKVVFGPDCFKEDYKIISVGGGQALAHYRDKTRIAYECVASNSKYILALYSGQTFGEDGIHHNAIIQFNWDGKPLKIFELDVPVKSFDVDWEHKVIYGLNTEDIPCILKFQM